MNGRHVGTVRDFPLRSSAEELRSTTYPVLLPPIPLFLLLFIGSLLKCRRRRRRRHCPLVVVTPIARRR